MRLLVISVPIGGWKTIPAIRGRRTSKRLVDAYRRSGVSPKAILRFATSANWTEPRRSVALQTRSSRHSCRNKHAIGRARATRKTRRGALLNRSLPICLWQRQYLPVRKSFLTLRSCPITDKALVRLTSMSRCFSPFSLTPSDSGTVLSNVGPIRPRFGSEFPTLRFCGNNPGTIRVPFGALL
jgi:hypothetical protein